jgi:hypothetical protein
MSREQESWRSDTACSLSSIRDFGGSRAEREKKLIVAYTGYLAISSHVHKVPFWAFKETVNQAFETRESAPTDVRDFMKYALGIDVNCMELPFCTICEKLGSSEAVVRCEAFPRGIPKDLYPWGGCKRAEMFKAKPGMEEISRSWMNLSSPQGSPVPSAPSSAGHFSAPLPAAEASGMPRG